MSTITDIRNIAVTVSETIHWAGVATMCSFDDPDQNRFHLVEDPQ